MRQSEKDIHAGPLRDGSGYEVNVADATGRKVHRFPNPPHSGETPPHGAGSFHDPEQHAVYMDRVEKLLFGEANP